MNNKEFLNAVKLVVKADNFFIKTPLINLKI